MITLNKNQKSFSLIESIIVCFIFLLLMVAISSSLLILYRTSGYQKEQSLAIEEARRGIEIMVKEIREAREGENGAYPIEFAGEKEFVFYSDIDGDGKTEKVRYFLAHFETKTQIKECESNQKGGSCNLSFFNFFIGNLKSAQVKISALGDLGSSNEYLEVFLDGKKIGEICKSACTDCAGSWQGTQIFDVTSQALDNNLDFYILATSAVEPFCPFSFKVKIELTFIEEIETDILKKGVIKPEGTPPVYPKEKEEISIISNFVRNSPPIFEYFNENLEKAKELKEIKIMRIFLVVNVDPFRPPNEYQLESFVYLRNLKRE